MAQLGNVRIDGLDLSGSMRNDLAAGMSASQFNSKYSASVPGFRPIALSRQVGGMAAPAAAPAAPAGPSIQDQLAAERAKWNGEVNSQYTKVNDAVANARNPLDIYNEALSRLGIGDARTRVTGLRQSLLDTENLIRALPGDVSARTTEFNLSENQRRRMVSQESEPLTQRQAVEGRNLEMANADVKDILAQGSAESEMEYKFQTDQRSAMMDQLKTAINRSDNAADREQWQKSYDQLERKQQQEAQLAREKFDFEKQQAAISNARAASSGGGSSSSKAAASKTSAQAGILKSLNANRGKDGYVSPTTYRAGKSDWVQSGYSGDEYDKVFGYLRNPAHAANPSWQQYQKG